jgi:hypothetical protein
MKITADRVMVVGMVLSGLMVTGLFWFGGISTGLIYDLDKELPVSGVVR